MKKEQGFTLIELMVVLAVIGVLAAMAFSAGGTNSAKAGRANAMAKLFDIRAKEEQYFIDNKAYTDDLFDLRMVAAAGDSLFMNSEGQPTDYASAAYEVTVSNTDGYTITATARNKQAEKEDDACKVLVLKASGSKTPVACW